jgi:Transposase IS200 like
MAWIARVVVPDLAHHVTQRGNRREPVFFEAEDYRLNRRLVAAAARRAGAAVWAYSLMPNHVHLPIMPTWRDAGGRGRVAGDLCRSAPALHRGDQRPLPVDGPSVPGSLWRGGDGRAAFVGGGPFTSLSIRWPRGW